MPPSIDVLTSSSAPAWPTELMPLKRTLPSPNVMVPKQSFETSRPVLPSAAYSMALSFLASPQFPWREGAGRLHGPYRTNLYYRRRAYSGEQRYGPLYRIGSRG